MGGANPTAPRGGRVPSATSRSLPNTSKCRSVRQIDVALVVGFRESAQNVGDGEFRESRGAPLHSGRSTARSAPFTTCFKEGSSGKGLRGIRSRP